MTIPPPPRPDPARGSLSLHLLLQAPLHHPPQVGSHCSVPTCQSGEPLTQIGLSMTAGPGRDTQGVWPGQTGGWTHRWMVRGRWEVG